MMDAIDFIALAAQCAPNVSPTTLLAIARVESGLDPYAVGVNGRPVRKIAAKDRAEATATASALIRSGRNLDLGLLQINSSNLARLSLTVEAAYDPCQNVAAAGRLLSAEYRHAYARAPTSQAALRIAVSRYNTGDDKRGFSNGYVAKVLGAARAAAPSAAARTTLPVDAPDVPQLVFGRSRNGLSPWEGDVR